MNILYPIINVYLLSSITILFGYTMDFTISKNTLKTYCKDDLDLYISGIQSSIINLLFYLALPKCFKLCNRSTQKYII